MSNEQEVIKPYEGPPPTPNNFADAFPEIADAAIKGMAPQRGRNPLDNESQRNLDQLKREMRATPPKHATVVNLHPWPLLINEKFTRGIVIPACNPGESFAHHHIRSWSHDQSYNEDGMSFKFSAIHPIQKASQFLITFANPEVYGGGVLIYESESHPSKVGEVEIYRPDGRVEVTLKNAIEYDDENHPIPVVQEIPVRRKFSELLAEETRRRNAFYMSRVEWADEKFKSTDVKEKKLITPMHRLMAEVLHADGILPALPDWNLASRMELGLAANNCKGCGNPVNKEACKCTTCGHILNPLAAYMEKEIQYGHVSLEGLTPEEWNMVEDEKERRDAVREEAKAQREKARAKGKKA